MYRSPTPTVDVAITDGKRIVLVRRGHEPYKGSWCLPGGFVEYGETVEESAIREVMEETGMQIELQEILGVYSSPDRDPRKHVLTTVFVAKPIAGEPSGGDDAADAQWFNLRDMETMTLGFDHGLIVRDLIEWFKSRKTYWSTRGRD